VVSLARGVSRQMAANSIIKVIWALDHEVVVVLVERYGELVQEAVCSENTLKGI
jgi:hypothetical protein